MIDFKMENILLNIFQSGKESDNVIAQIAILTIKSLMPSSNEIGNRIDYKRFGEELKLWKYYRVGENLSLLNILGEINEEVYFNIKDDTLYSRIIPIVLSNSEYTIIEDEIIKNIIYSTGNMETLFEWLLIGRALFLIIEKEEDIEEALKEYVINISQMDFLNRYRSIYRLSLDKYPGNYAVDFERERLNQLNLLNGININRYRVLKDLLDVLKGDMPKTSFGNIIYDSMRERDKEYKLNGFYTSMNDYIFKLRKSRINPKDLKIAEYILPDIFSFDEGEAFFHSLLRNSKVMKKEIRNGTLISLIGTKTGMYMFRKNPI